MGVGRGKVSAERQRREAIDEGRNQPQYVTLSGMKNPCKTGLGFVVIPRSPDAVICKSTVSLMVRAKYPRKSPVQRAAWQFPSRCPALE